MKKLTKILLLVLTVALLIGAMAVGAFAATDDASAVEEGLHWKYTDSSDTTQYAADLGTAVTGAKAGSTIYLLDSYKLTTSAKIATIDKELTIDLGGNTFEVSQSSSAAKIDVSTSAPFTIKNGVLNVCANKTATTESFSSYGRNYGFLYVNANDVDINLDGVTTYIGTLVYNYRFSGYHRTKLTVNGGDHYAIYAGLDGWGTGYFITSSNFTFEANGARFLVAYQGGILGAETYKAGNKASQRHSTATFNDCYIEHTSSADGLDNKSFIRRASSATYFYFNGCDVKGCFKPTTASHEIYTDENDPSESVGAVTDANFVFGKGSRWTVTYNGSASWNEETKILTYNGTDYRLYVPVAAPGLQEFAISKAVKQGFDTLPAYPNEDGTIVYNSTANPMKDGSTIISGTRSVTYKKLYDTYNYKYVVGGEEVYSHTDVQNLTTAFAAADTGSTITLLGDAMLHEYNTTPKYVTVSKELTFDLNGHTLIARRDSKYSDAGIFYVNNGVTFTLKSSQVGGKIFVAAIDGNADPVIDAREGSTTNIIGCDENGNTTLTTYGGSLIRTYSQSANATIKGGAYYKVSDRDEAIVRFRKNFTFTAQDAFFYDISPKTTDGVFSFSGAAATTSTGTATIDNCVIVSNSNAVVCTFAKADITFTDCYISGDIKPSTASGQTAGVVKLGVGCLINGETNEQVVLADNTQYEDVSETMDIVATYNTLVYAGGLVHPSSYDLKSYPETHTFTKKVVEMPPLPPAYRYTAGGVVVEKPHTDSFNLINAINAADAGTTVYLLSDETLVDSQSISKNITIDLNGYTLTLQQTDKKSIEIKANVTITGTENGGTLKCYYTVESKKGKAYSMFGVAKNKTLTLTDVKSYTGGLLYSYDNDDCALVINGGEHHMVLTGDTGWDNSFFDTRTSISVTANGAKFYLGSHSLIGACNNKTDASKNENTAHTFTFNNCYILGSSSTTNIVTRANANTTIAFNGCYIVGKINPTPYESGSVMQAGSITLGAGTYIANSSMVTAAGVAVVPDGYAQYGIKNEVGFKMSYSSGSMFDGTFTTSESTKTYTFTKVVATEAEMLANYDFIVGDAYFKGTFAEAIAAAEDGATIKLLKATSASELAFDKSITLDLNGNTLTFTGSSITVADGKTLTITGGTFAISGATYVSGNATITATLPEGYAAYNVNKAPDGSACSVIIATKAEMEANYDFIVGAMYFKGTMVEAVSAAATGSTVKLLRDVTFEGANSATDVLVINKSLTIELNNKTIKINQQHQNAINVGGSSTVTFQNGTMIAYNATKKLAYSLLECGSNATININNIKSYTGGLVYTYQGNNMKVNISGGEHHMIFQPDGAWGSLIEFRGAATVTAEDALFYIGDKSLTLVLATSYKDTKDTTSAHSYTFTDCTILTVDPTATQILENAHKNVTVTFDGCYIAGHLNPPVYSSDKSTVGTDSCTIILGHGTYLANGITVMSGTQVADGYVYSEIDETESYTLNCYSSFDSETGALITSSTTKNFTFVKKVANENEALENADFIVTVDGVENYVSGNLADAIAVAETGSVSHIFFCKEGVTYTYTVNNRVTITKEITVDLNGNTLAIDQQTYKVFAFYFTTTNPFVIENGNIVVTRNSETTLASYPIFAMDGGKACNLTLNSLNVTSGAFLYNVKAHGSTITVNDCIFHLNDTHKDTSGGIIESRTNTTFIANNSKFYLETDHLLVSMSYNLVSGTPGSTFTFTNCDIYRPNANDDLIGNANNYTTVYFNGCNIRGKINAAGLHTYDTKYSVVASTSANYVIGEGTTIAAGSKYQAVFADGLVAIYDGAEYTFAPTGAIYTKAFVVASADNAKFTVTVGGVEYYFNGTIDEAIAIVSDGGTIKLLAAASISELAFDKSVTLDLNEQTLTFSGNLITVADGKTLNITNGAFNISAVTYISGSATISATLPAGYAAYSVNMAPDESACSAIIATKAEMDANYDFLVGDTYFKGTLAGAITAATDGSTITFLKDATITGTEEGKETGLTVGKNLTINLNYKTLTFLQLTKNKIVIGSSKTVTFKDGTINAHYTSSTTKGSAIFLPGSNSKLFLVDVNTNSAGLFSNWDKTGWKITVTGGVHTSIGTGDHWNGILMSCSNAEFEATGATFNVGSQSLISDSAYQLSATDAKVKTHKYTFNNCTIIANSAGNNLFGRATNVTLAIFNNCYIKAELNAPALDGSDKGKGYAAIGTGCIVLGAGTRLASGSDVADIATMADGYALYTVNEVIGGVTYTKVVATQAEMLANYTFLVNDAYVKGTFAEVIAAAADGATVKLLNALSLSGLTLDKSITLDLGGKTFTYSGNLITVADGKTLTIKNGTLSVSGEVYVSGNVTISATLPEGYGAYGVEETVDDVVCNIIICHSSHFASGYNYSITIGGIETFYTGTFADAIDKVLAAKKASIIKLLGDMEFVIPANDASTDANEAQIKLNYNTTFDLNGYTLTVKSLASNSTGFYFTKNVTMKVCDTSANGGGKLFSYYQNSAGKLLFEGFALFNFSGANAKMVFDNVTTYSGCLVASYDSKDITLELTNSEHHILGRNGNLAGGVIESRANITVTATGAKFYSNYVHSHYGHETNHNTYAMFNIMSYKQTSGTKQNTLTFTDCYFYHTSTKDQIFTINTYTTVTIDGGVIAASIQPLSGTTTSEEKGYAPLAGSIIIKKGTVVAQGVKLSDVVKLEDGSVGCYYGVAEEVNFGLIVDGVVTPTDVEITPAYKVGLASNVRFQLIVGGVQIYADSTVSFADVIEAADAGTTLYVLESFTIIAPTKSEAESTGRNFYANIDKALTIDLGGNTVYFSQSYKNSSYFYISTASEVIIRNGTFVWNINENYVNAHNEEEMSKDENARNMWSLDDDYSRSSFSLFVVSNSVHANVTFDGINGYGGTLIYSYSSTGSTVNITGGEYHIYASHDLLGGGLVEFRANATLNVSGATIYIDGGTLMTLTSNKENGAASSSATFTNCDIIATDVGVNILRTLNGNTTVRFDTCKIFGSINPVLNTQDYKTVESNKVFSPEPKAGSVIIGNGTLLMKEATLLVDVVVAESGKAFVDADAYHSIPLALADGSIYNIANEEEITFVISSGSKTATFTLTVGEPPITQLIVTWYKEDGITVIKREYVDPGTIVTAPEYTPGAGNGWYKIGFELGGWTKSFGSSEKVTDFTINQNTNFYPLQVATEGSAPTAHLSGAQYNLSFTGQVILNFYLPNNPSNVTNIRVTDEAGNAIDYDGVYVVDANGEKVYYRLYEVARIETTRLTEAKIIYVYFNVDGYELRQKVTLNPLNYTKNILADSKSANPVWTPATHTMMADMVRYSNYLSYAVTGSTVAALDEVLATYESVCSPLPSGNDFGEFNTSTSAIKGYVTSISYDVTKYEPRWIFALDASKKITDVKITLDGYYPKADENGVNYGSITYGVDTAKSTTNGNYYTEVYIESIPVYNIDKTITITLTIEGGETISANYNLNTYFNYMEATGDELYRYQLFLRAFRAFGISSAGYKYSSGKVQANVPAKDFFVCDHATAMSSAFSVDNGRYCSTCRTYVFFYDDYINAGTWGGQIFDDREVAISSGETGNVYSAVDACHYYANAKSAKTNPETHALYKVGCVATSGKLYYFRDSKDMNGAINEIEVYTDTCWAGAYILIDDSHLQCKVDKNTAASDYDQDYYTTVFGLRSNYSVTDAYGNAISNSGKSVEKHFTNSIAAGATKIDYAPGVPMMIQLNDSNVKHFIRQGANADSGRDQGDMIIIDEYGNVSNTTPIEWSYDVTSSGFSATAYYITNPAIKLSGLDANGNISCTFENITRTGIRNDTYQQCARGILVRRANTTVEGFDRIFTEDNTKDTTRQTYRGFVHVWLSYNAVCKDMLVQQHITHYDAEGVTLGSYEISGENSLNTSWINYTQKNFFTNGYGDFGSTGLMGTNGMKNMYMKNCLLSSFDAHSAAYNVTLEDCTFEHINFIGGGDIRMKNITVYLAGSSGTGIVLRQDYGSRWEGNMYIDGLEYRWQSGEYTNSYIDLVKASYTNHDFGFGHEDGANELPTNIYVYNLSVKKYDRTNYNELVFENGKLHEESIVEDNSKKIAIYYQLNNQMNNYTDYTKYKEGTSVLGTMIGQQLNPMKCTENVYITTDQELSFQYPTKNFFKNMNVFVNGKEVK